jgi:2-methylisocitrate lyase-like PEP mutase family enzyme
MSAMLDDRADNPRRLRELIEAPEIVLAPGAYDCLSARLIEHAGFPVVYMTGFGTSASYLGRPDVGLLGMSEMVEQARRIVQAVGVPVIADADTGYGNAINVIRTVQAYEDAGVAAIHLEDQVSPKRCGHMEGKQLVPPAEMVTKVRAAVAARRSPNFTIIARTDARAVEGIEGAIERGALYRKAGADVLFIEAPETEQDVEAIATAFSGVPLLFNWAEGGKTPPVPVARLQRLGYRIIIFPIGALLVAARAVADLLEVIKREGTPHTSLGKMVPFEAFTTFLGLREIRQLEQRFSGGEAPARLAPERGEHDGGGVSESERQQ